MPHNYQNKKHVVFTAFSAVPKEIAENTQFDIYKDDGLTNDTYCRILMSKIFKLPYRLLPDFITHHTALVSNTIPFKYRRNFLHQELSWINVRKKISFEGL